MPRFVAATYHAAIKVAEFVTDDGRHLLRAGGTLPWRINNCGDLISPVNSCGEPNPRLTRGYLGFAGILNKDATQTHHFFIFPDYGTGRRELEASLKRKYAKKCIPDLVKAYAPSHENESTAYKEKLLSATGIEPDKKVSDLSTEEFTKLANAIEKLEGYHNNADSRRETWVPVTTITATDGARPLADEEIILRINGKETNLRSNAVGQFPLIPHSQDPTEILQRTSDGKLKNVGTIDGEQGKSLSLVKQLQRFAGMAGPDKPPVDADEKKQPFTYHVQAGDTLSSIAKRFRTSVDRIKIDNNRRSDKLFTSEILGIYGPPPQGEMPVKATPRAAPTLISSNTNTSTDRLDTKIQSQTTFPTRSDEGEGKPLALIPNDQRIAPWMVYAIAEAKRWKGTTESEIEAKGMNYHKAISDGIPTMIGNLNAWCAAFVNWCLSQAGYAIDTKSIWAARARGIRSHDLMDEKGKLIQNPLFSQIETPIYGCIAMQTSLPKYIGHHVGFVYAKPDEHRLVLLGGNQSDRIMFENYLIASNKEKLEYFVPAAYKTQAEKEASKALPTMSAKELNASFEISTDKSYSGNTR